MKRTFDISHNLERGATLVETAIVVPMLIMLAIGLAEVAFLVVDDMAVANAAREGARVGAAAGPYVSGSITADTLMLRSVEQAVCDLENGSLTQVTIYLADADGQLPSNPNLKNVYVPPVSGVLNCSSSGSTSLTCSNGCPWAPSSRDNVPPDLDNVGVLVEFQHRPLLGLFPFTGTFSLSDRAVMRIEPNTRG
jgi:hypothetical protein